MFCPGITFDVISITVFAHASAAPAGTGPDEGGGTVLTFTVAEPDPVPPVGHVVFPVEVIVYVCVPVAMGVTFKLRGLLDVLPVYGPPLPLTV